MKAIAKLAICSLLLMSALHARADGAPHVAEVLTDGGAVLWDDEDLWSDGVFPLDGIPHIEN